jgi:tryptophan 7-halogenase
MKFLVLGGGSAGWLTAMFLQKTYKSAEIVVVEDPKTPPIIAGESGSVAVNSLLNFLEIDMDEWIKETNAVPKLGGKLVNWDSVGTHFWHALSDSKYALADWDENRTTIQSNMHYLSCVLADNISFEEVFYCWPLMEQNKLPIVLNEENQLVSVLKQPMFHFDSRAQAAYLKKLGLERNITLIEGRYINSIKDEKGNISSINLEDGRTISADWFFDCSGFARLLLKKEMGAKFNDYTDFFPARSAVAWWADSELKSYTEITAMKYGWSWNINLQHRSGNGYLYDPDLISVEQAVAEAEEYYGIKIDPVAKVTFTPSLTETSWVNNVIAIGLSSGFLEPLESNGLSQVVAQIELLERFWTPIDHNQKQCDLYNKYQLALMYEILVFLCLHYRTHRRDSEYWLSHAYDKNRIPDSLKQDLEMWSNGILIDDRDNLRVFSLESIAQVTSGLNLINREKLKASILSKNPNRFESFYRHQNDLSIEIKNIVNLCCSVNKWAEIF